MNYKQAYQNEYKGGCGHWGRGKFGNQWGRGRFGSFWGRHGMGGAPVNIAETDTEYVISLFAAGLAKENITLGVKDDVLTISYPGAGTAEQGTSGNYTYQEYNQSGFERQFQLNNKVLTDQISASYADGILKVTLPKNPETNKPAQSINVA